MKNEQNARMLPDICPKIPEFYSLHDNCPKNIFPEFLEARAHCAPRLLHLYEQQRFTIWEEQLIGMS